MSVLWWIGYVCLSATVVALVLAVTFLYRTVIAGHSANEWPSGSIDPNGRLPEIVGWTYPTRQAGSFKFPEGSEFLLVFVPDRANGWSATMSAIALARRFEVACGVVVEARSPAVEVEWLNGLLSEPTVFFAAFYSFRQLQISRPAVGLVRDSRLVQLTADVGDPIRLAWALEPFIGGLELSREGGRKA